ncbi:serine/threonine-protein kinase ATM [Dorcoceras hygrometricum]|uniref:Serine/threonine-protein kinase ATM n=1 Tax=Dorcoceras hygrometricum TaxID=472368 RepID=A0A2Z7BPH3_9LAMI|nr:serine/threonine-protein kinase ATM [Dorcoceras hygrometricum]
MVKRRRFDKLKRSVLGATLLISCWKRSSRESLPCLPSQERSGCLGRELQRLVITLLRCVVPEKSNAIIGVVTTGFECLPPSYDGLTGSEYHGPMISPIDTSCGYRG